MAWWKQSLSQKSTGLGYGSGFIGTEVISFSKLAINILNVVPNSPVLIPSRLDSLCVREAIERVSDEQTLSYFEPIREKPGTLAVIEKSIHTLQRACITPQMLKDEAADDPKAADTAAVYCKYLEILGEHHWVGSAGLLNAAAQILSQQHTPLVSCPLFIVDGFNELTKDCRNLLKALTPYCDEILITLPSRPDSDNLTDRRILDNGSVICSELDAEIIMPQNQPLKSDVFRLAESVFYPSQTHNGTKMMVSDDHFLMIEASSRSTEVREALRKLKKRFVHEKLRAADCAVFVTDMNAYVPVLRQFGREMGIPLRFSQKQPLSGSPAASALMRLLKLSPDFETLEVLSVLRLPFLSGCPDPEDNSGENYSTDLFTLDRIGRKMNVLNGMDDWKSAFKDAMKSAPECINRNTEDSTDVDEDGKLYEYPEKKKLERIQNSFLKFAELLTPPDGLLSRASWVAWLEKILTAIRFYEQIEDRNGRSFQSDFRALLKRIIFCEEKLSLPAVSYAEFLSELETELESSAQTEPEYAADRIFVGDISQTSGCRWKLVVLIGFAEGVFPRAEHEDLILTNALREKLSLPREIDQQLLFHHALTRSDSVMILTRPQKTDKGEEWPASIYWQTLRENLADHANLYSVTENMPIIPASPEEFAFRLARSGQKDLQEDIPGLDREKINKLLENARHEQMCLQLQSAGKYNPETDTELKSALSDPVRDAVPYSCSAIETWLTCPFKYFLMKKLHLEQPQEPGTGMDAAQIGTMNHRVMELTFAPGTVFSSKEQSLEKASEIIEKVFADAPAEFGFKASELWEFEKDKYRQKLLESIDKMFEAKRTAMPVNSSWSVVGAEMEFGYPDKGYQNTEPLTVETTAGPIQIRGVIDRVDRCDNGMLRVVDYKTGLSGFGKEEIEAGAHIQAGVYAAAVVHALQLGTKCEGLYWSINYKTVKEYTMYDSETQETIPNIEFLNKFAEGIRDASYPAESAGGTCPDYCPAAGWCKKYVRREFYG